MLNKRTPICIKVTVYKLEVYLLNTLFKSEMRYYVGNTYIYEGGEEVEFDAKRISKDRYKRLYSQPRFQKYILMPGVAEWQFYHPSYVREFSKSFFKLSKL